MRTTVEHHHAVLLRTAKELVAAALRHTLNQYLVSLAHTAGIVFSREAVLQGDDFVQATNLHLFRDIIGQMLGEVCPKLSLITEMATPSSLAVVAQLWRAT